MKRNDQNNPQGYGYPQQNGYPQDIYQGYSAPQGYQASSQGYTQAPGYSQAQGYGQAQGFPQAQGFRQNQGFTQNQGYPQGQGYQQPQEYPQMQGFQQATGYQAARNYQTPQVPVTQGETGSAPYAGQAPYARSGYPQQGGQGYGQSPAGAPGSAYPQQNGYPQQNANGYGYGNTQPQAGSYIPQMPSYTQAFTAQGYPAAGNYQQGYPPYNNQMGRNPQPSYNANQDMGGHVPLNGGGYVPQPVPVRKKPFELTDTYLLIISAVLLILFALGMFAAGMSFLKIPFVILAAGTTAALWIKPMTDNNKRLCYTIVFGLLVLVTIIGFLTGGSGQRRSNTQQANMSQAGVPDTIQQQADNSIPVPQTMPPAVTVTPAPEEQKSQETIDRAMAFMEYWKANKQAEMLKLCAPSWISKQEKPDQELFYALGTKTPLSNKFVQINGTVNDTNRGVVIDVTMNNNNGKDNSEYRMTVMMILEDGVWYVDPDSVRSNQPKETTPKPTLTAAPTPECYPNTPLYYNPDKGTLYHIDQNCSKVGKKYLPLQGIFYFSQINDPEYKNLERCNVCGAPFRPKE